LSFQGLLIVYVITIDETRVFEHGLQDRRHAVLVFELWNAEQVAMLSAVYASCSSMV